MQIGKLVKQPQGFKAFILNKFPPEEGFSFSQKLIKKAADATSALSKLVGITQLLPDINFFLLMYIRKDAASSSQIEGTKATMVDAIEAELSTSKPLHGDVDDILHYIEAIDYGLKQLNKIPLCLRTIKEIHKKLMDGARVTHYSDPGNFRRSQNWIGGTSPGNASFVPPPVHDMNKALDDLEKFFHCDDDIIPIIKAGLIHAQFETIHPFLDGNGRTGRILISLFLSKEKLLDHPVLYLSSYFKKHQKVYYARLNAYHDNEVEAWMDFFLDGVIETSWEAIETTRRINALREKDMKKIQALGKKTAGNAANILSHLFKSPIVSVAHIQKITGFTRPGAQKIIDKFVELDILRIRNKHKVYARSFIYRKYVDIFNE